MTTTRYHFTFRVDTWAPDGESIVEHVAGVEDYERQSSENSDVSFCSAMGTDAAGVRTVDQPPLSGPAGMLV